MFSYLRIGRFRDLELSDIHPIPIEHSSEVIAKRMTDSWLLEQNKSSPKLTTALIATFLPNFAYGTFLAILKDCVFRQVWIFDVCEHFLHECVNFRVAQGPALGILMVCFSGLSEYEPIYGIFAGAGLIVSLLLFTIFHHYSIFLFYQLGMNIRVALTMLIYDKVI